MKKLNEITPDDLNDALNKYVRIKNIVGIIIFIIILIAIIASFINPNKPEETKNEEPEIKEEQPSFTTSELIAWELFKNEAIKQNIIDEDNLESIELVSIWDYGHYKKSEPNIRYEQANFTYTCIDQTKDCIKMNNYEYNDKYKFYSYPFIIDIKDSNYIKIGGYSFNQSDELVPVEEPFTYEELDN